MSNPSSYSAIYAFGDSLSDAGNASIATALVGSRIPVSPPYYKQSYGPFGTFTATVFSNGPTWVQDLSPLLGRGTLRPSLYAGTDFAYGGAETGSAAGSSNGLEISAISLPSQLTQFQALVPAPSPGALYTLSIGTNDTIAILDTPGLTMPEMISQVSAAVSSEMSFISALAGRGAQNLLVADVPDLGKVPVVTQRQDPSEDTLASQLSNLYNIDLNAALETMAPARGINLHILPIYSLLDQAVAEPSQFGLTNATDPVWSGNFTDSSSGTLAATTLAQQNQYLFWDHYHPTAHVHQLIADDAQSLVTTGNPLFPTPTVQMTDTTTGVSSTQFGEVYSGPDTGLQGQFLYLGPDSVVLSANAPDMYFAGGSGTDAIAVSSGHNVLDGAEGSSFLVGGTGQDAFYVDAGGQSTWNEIVNFHPGDTFTLRGFQPGVSTAFWTDGEGAPGYTGATLHVDAAGTGQVWTSTTFAGTTAAAMSRYAEQTGMPGGVGSLTILTS
jgi:phospholipase/lecithinase/hemolysin